MQLKHVRKVVIIGAVVLMSGAVVAFAQGGRGMGGWGGHMMGYGSGYGYGMGPGMMGYGPGYGMGPGMMGYGYNGYGYGQGRGMRFGNLSDEDQAKLDAAREKFLASTAKLREQIEDTQFALAQQWRKDNPDAAKITALQKDLSKLEGEFDVKMVQHRLEMRKLLPDNVQQGYGRGYARGYCWQ